MLKTKKLAIVFSSIFLISLIGFYAITIKNFFYNKGIDENNSSLGGNMKIATTNGIDDNVNFIQWIEDNKKIYIPENITLKLGYTTKGKYIKINKSIEIYGGGTIDFIGDFSVNSLFKVSTENVIFNGINFTNNTGTKSSFANDFISTIDNTVNNLVLKECSFTNGGISLLRCTNCKIQNNIVYNGSVLLIGGNNNRVERNNIQAPTDTITGINLLSYSNDITKDYYIGHNTITNVYYSGITLHNQGGPISNCLIEYNTIKVAGNIGSNHVIPISLAKVTKVTCKNNDIFGANNSKMYFAIECADSSDCLIKENRLEGVSSGIIINGTSRGVSFNNIVEHNFIYNWVDEGIRLYRYTSGNFIRNNIIKSSTIDASNRVYGIRFDADSKNEFNFNQCYDNQIDIDGSTLSNVKSIYGIYAYSTSTKYKDNTIVIKAPNNTVGIKVYCGDNYGMTYGKNTDISNNEIMMTITSISNSSYGIEIIHTGINDNLINGTIKYNRINNMYGNELSYNASKIGNASIENNFTVD